MQFYDLRAKYFGQQPAAVAAECRVFFVPEMSAKHRAGGTLSVLVRRVAAVQDKSHSVRSRVFRPNQPTYCCGRCIIIIIRKLRVYSRRCNYYAETLHGGATSAIRT